MYCARPMAKRSGFDPLGGETVTDVRASILSSPMPVHLYAHIVWTTLHRQPMIEPEVAAFLGRFLPAEAKRHGARMIALGIVSDHVHMLLELPAVFDLPRLVQGLKGASSRLAARELGEAHRGLIWATGYTAKSVSPGSLKRVTNYLESQARRHPDDAVDGHPSSDARVVVQATDSTASPANANTC